MGLHRKIGWVLAAVLLMAVRASATISVVVSTSITATAGTTSNVTTPSANTTGSGALVVFLEDFQGTVTGTLTDNQGNTWTLAGSATYTDAVTCRLRCYICMNPTTNAAHTFNYTSGAASYPTMYVFGLSGTSGRDVQNGAGLAAATSGQPGSITPTSDSALVFCAAIAAAGSAPTISSPYSVLGSTSFLNGVRFATMVASNTQTTATATNPTVTYSTSTVSAVMIIAFKNIVPTATSRGLMTWFNMTR